MTAKHLALLLICASACADPEKDPRYILDGDPTDTATSSETGIADTAAPQATLDLAFDEATLDPPFTHVNAIWAGVALLDYDMDGWLDIFLPNGKNSPDRLYRNLGDGRFEDVAAEAGLDSLAENGAAAAGDLDNDGDPDLLVIQTCSTGSWNSSGELAGWLHDSQLRLYHNDGSGTFTEEELGLEGTFELPGDAGSEDISEVLKRCTTSATLADVDGDGMLDAVLATGFDPDFLPPWTFVKDNEVSFNAVLYNDGTGHFNRMGTEGTSLPGFLVSFVSAVFDLTGDGRSDIVWADGGGRLLVDAQQSDGSFEEQWDETDAGYGLWMGLAVADFDGDQDLDLFATNQGLSPLLTGYDNLPFLGSGDEASDEGVGDVVEQLNPFHSLILNDDGRLTPAKDWPIEADQLLAGDLYGTHGVVREDVGMDGDLQRYPWGWGAVALDVDSDGWMDVAFTGNNGSAPMNIIWSEDNGAGPGALLLNQAGMGFRDITWEAGVENVDAEGRYQDGRGIATGDLNNDGYPDLVIANRTYNPSQSNPLAQEVGLPRILLSRPRGDNHWLQIDPIGTTSNRDGIGTIIRITGGDHPATVIMGAGGNTCSSSERLATIGLGSATQVDLEVIFPSGKIVKMEDVSADQRIEVLEP